VGFEACSPVRLFSSWRGKRDFRLLLSSKNHRHVGFESRYERTALMVLDRESSVIVISSQPMWIFWPSNSAPNRALRTSSCAMTTVTVRSLTFDHERVDETAAATFEATRLLCVEQGFGYRVMSDFDQTLIKTCASFPATVLPRWAHSRQSRRHRRTKPNPARHPRHPVAQHPRRQPPACRPGRLCPRNPQSLRGYLNIRRSPTGRSSRPVIASYQHHFRRTRNMQLA
jgi:hypothetical protein